MGMVGHLVMPMVLRITRARKITGLRSMGRITPMGTETTASLTLMQWLSPAFPVGSYAYSHGLEQVVCAGQVHDAPSLTIWLEDVLRFGAGQADAILLCHARHGADVSHLAQAMAPSRERLQETMDQGAAFLAVTNALYGEDRAPLPLAVAVGTLSQRLDCGDHTVAALYLHAFMSNLVSVAVRFVPLGQTDGQAVLAQLHPVIEAVASEACTADLDDIATMVPLADLAAMIHETQPVRVFRT